MKEGYLDTCDNTTLQTLCEVINLRTERDKYYMTLLVCGILKRQIYESTGQHGGSWGLGDRKM